MNPFIESQYAVWNDPKHVFINEERLNEVAASIKVGEMKIPNWREPVFPPADDDRFLNFIGVGNCINFAFTDFETHQSFSVHYKDSLWRGAFAMWACLLRALESGIEILNGAYLSELDPRLCEELFAGQSRIPMLEERCEVLRQVGTVLKSKYGGFFSNLFEVAGYRAFNNGEGIVERLTADFPSFCDESKFGPDDSVLKFHKRAQLLPMMYQGRALSTTKLTRLDDFEDLGPIADYAVPKALHTSGILIYSEALWNKVKQWQLIEKDSREEQELRAQTVHVQVKLQEQLNRRESSDVNTLQVDFLVWSMGRGGGEPHHLTRTIAY
jgi:hypothetical protein